MIFPHYIFIRKYFQDSSHNQENIFYGILPVAGWE